MDTITRLWSIFHTPEEIHVTSHGCLEKSGEESESTNEQWEPAGIPTATRSILTPHWKQSLSF